MNFTQDFGFIADEAVGEKADETKALGIVWKIERGFDAFNHHRATFGVERTEISQAALDVFRRGFERTVAQSRGAEREVDKLKRIARAQQLKGAFDGGLGLLEREAAHAARAIA